jgi:hypothetical membrane protein
MSKQKSNLVRLVRRTQTLISIILFFIILIFCWKTTGLELNKIQLSFWGSSDLRFGWLWNSIIVLLSISILVNNILFVKKHVRLRIKTISYIMFSFVALCLMMVGIFNLDYGALHDVSAWLYFFAYPFSIFIMAYLNRKFLLYEEWFTHLILSIIMIILPMSFITMFDGLAIPEILHSIIVSIWNIYTAFKRFDIGFKMVK